MTTSPAMTFLGAAHIDRIGRGNRKLRSGRSNPGTFSEVVGGAALNSASIFQALGGRAALVSAVGNDPAGEFVRRTCAERALQTSFTPAPQTATYTALLEPDGSVALAMADMAAYEDVSSERITVTGKAPLFVDANFASIAEIATHHAGPIFAAATSVAKVHRLLPLLPKIDILFCNRGELLALFDLSAEIDDQTLQETMIRFELRLAVVSDGAGPVLALAPTQVTRIDVSEPTEIRDHTGAGDALAAACLFRYLGGADLPTSIRFGCEICARILAVDGPFHADLCEN